MGVVKRQTIKNTLSSYAGIGLGFVSLLFIQPNFLKPEEIGLARVLFAFSTLISSFISLGVANVTFKYFPYYKNEHKGHHGFLGFVLLFPLLGFVLVSLGLLVVKEFVIAQYRRESPLFIDYFYYIFPFSFFLSCTTIFSSYLISLFKSTVPSYLTDIYTRVAYIVLIFIYYFNYVTLPVFIAAYVGIYAVQVLLLLIYLAKVDKPTLFPDEEFARKADVKEMLLFGFMLSFTAIAVLGLKTLDSVLLAKFLPLSAVGVYAIVSFIPTVIEAPYNALDRIATAKISHATAANDTQELRSVFYQSVKYLTLIGGLLFVGVNCNINYLLALVGKEYAAAEKVVWIISLGSLVNMMGGANNAIVMYASKYWVAALISVVMVALTFALNMLLIPRFGLEGAAVATALSWGGYTCVRVFLVWKKFDFQPYGINTFKNLFLIAGCVLLHVVLPEADTPLANLVLRSFMLGGVYITGAYFLQLAPELHRYLPWRK